MSIPVGPHTKKLMEKIAAEGNESAEFTQEEKLALVADGLMAPEEAGIASAEEAHLEIEPQAKPKPDFGDTVMLQAGVIPLELRAQWAYQDTKIILAPADKTQWIKDWMKENSNTFKIQCGMRCGNLEAKFQRTYTDPVLGLAAILEIASRQLEAAYTGKPCEPTTDPSEIPALPAPEVPLQLEDKKDEPAS